MATREQLMGAFRLAHDAGDEQAMSDIADMLDAMPSDAGPAEPAEEATVPGELARGVGRGVRAVGQLGAALSKYHPVAYGLREAEKGLFGTEVLSLPIKGAEALLGATEPMVARQLPPQGPGTEAAISGAEALGGGLAGGGVLSGPAALAAGTGALGTAAGRYLAESQDMGPGATMATELAGGLAGGLAPSISRLLRAGSALKEQAGDVIGRFYNRDVPSQAARRDAINAVRREIERTGENFDDVLARLRGSLARGEEGSLATLTESPLVRGLQEQLPRSLGPQLGQEARGALQDLAERTSQQASGRVTGIAPEGQPARLTEAAKRVQGTVREGIRRGTRRGLERAMGRETQAEALRAGVRGAQAQAQPVRQAGQAVSETVESARTAAKNLEREAWSRIPDDELLRSAYVKSAKDQWLRTLDSTERDMVESTFKTELGYIDNLDPTVSGPQINTIRSAVTDKIKEMFPQGAAGTNKDRLGNQLRQLLRDVIADSPGGPLVEDARRASLERISTFDDSLLGKARRATRDTPEVLAERLTPTGTGGRRVVESALGADQFAAPGTPGVQGALRQSLQAQFYEKLRDGSPRQAQSWLDQRRETMERFPDLQRQAQAAIDDLNRAQGLTREGEVLAKAVQTRAARQRTTAGTLPTAQFLGGKDPVEVVAKAYKAPDRVRQARALARAATGKGGPRRSVRGLQAAYREAVADQVLAGKSPTASQRKALQEVMTPGQMQQLDEAVRLVSRLGGDKITPHAEILSRAPSMSRDFGVALARASGANIGGLVISNPLIAARMGSEMAKNVTDTIPQQQFRRALLNYMLEPQRFADDVKLLNAPDVTPTQLRKILRRILTKATTMSGVAAATVED